MICNPQQENEYPLPMTSLRNGLVLFTQFQETKITAVGAIYYFCYCLTKSVY